MNDWTFSDFGAAFDGHAAGHLPHYGQAHEVVAAAASYALPPGGLVADCGCSTGYALGRLAAAMPDRHFSAVGYDVDASMLAAAKARLAGCANVDVSLVGADLAGAGDVLEHDDADLTLVLWTLQFLPPRCWQPLLAALRQRATADGLLVVAAKTRLADARFQEIADGALADFKAAAGVAPAEVLAKARSLRGTMLVASPARLAAVIVAAGWDRPTVLWRWHAWLVLAAWAAPVASDTDP